jgi:hypothetical protein
MQPVPLNVHIGHTKYSNGGEVYATSYHDGSLALILRDEYTSRQSLKLTVNMSEYGKSAALESNSVWIKSWFENEGIEEAIKNSPELGEFTGRKHATGFVEALELRLSEQVMATIKGEEKDA